MNPKEIIKQKIAEVDASIRNYIAGGEMSAIVKKTSERYGLNEEQEIGLENEVLFVLLGMELRSSFLRNIRSVLNSNDSVTASINQVIGQQIFSKFEALLPKEEEGVNVVGELELPQATDVLPPYNLPVGTSLEEKIAPTVGSPGQKLSWEERKKQTGESKVVTDKYSGNDPYREPLS